MDVCPASRVFNCLPVCLQVVEQAAAQVQAVKADLAARIAEVSVFASMAIAREGLVGKQGEVLLVLVHCLRHACLAVVGLVRG